jgi:predicted nucleic acid-binding protein
MATLIDTNVLLRLTQPHHPHCALAERAVATLRTTIMTFNVQDFARYSCISAVHPATVA